MDFILQWELCYLCISFTRNWTAEFSVRSGCMALYHLNCWRVLNLFARFMVRFMDGIGCNDEKHWKMWVSLARRFPPMLVNWVAGRRCNYSYAVFFGYIRACKHEAASKQRNKKLELKTNKIWSINIVKQASCICIVSSALCRWAFSESS